MNVDFMGEMVPTGHNEIQGLSTDFNPYIQSQTLKLLKLLRNLIFLAFLLIHLSNLIHIYHSSLNTSFKLW